MGDSRGEIRAGATAEARGRGSAGEVSRGRVRAEAEWKQWKWKQWRCHWWRCSEGKSRGIVERWPKAKFWKRPEKDSQKSHVIHSWEPYTCQLIKPRRRQLRMTITKRLHPKNKQMMVSCVRTTRSTGIVLSIIIKKLNAEHMPSTRRYAMNSAWQLALFVLLRPFAVELGLSFIAPLITMMLPYMNFRLVKSVLVGCQNRFYWRNLHWIKRAGWTTQFWRSSKVR
jgi:hypothetical protein